MRITLLVTVLAPVILAGCSGSSPSVRLDPRIRLSVAFVDSRWNGEEIPVVGRCGDCGGEGRSPELRIGGLTADVDEVIVEFNDLRIRDLATGGGHGVLGVATGGRPDVVLPSVREETMVLPGGVRSVSKHRCGFYGHKAGAYKAPCGCGHGNTYVAVVKALRHEGDSTVVVAQQTFPLGVF